jgi:hypothetical protein
MDMEKQVIAPQPRGGKKWKITAIIMIILTVVLAAATGFFVWKFLEQKSEIENLKVEIAKIQTELDGTKAAKDDADVSAFESGKVIVSSDILIELLKKHLEIDPATRTNMSITSFYNSEYEPFQAVRAGVSEYDSAGNFLSGGIAYFYRKGDDGAWQYAVSGNGIPSCQEFVGDAKYALSKLDCSSPSTGGITTVGEYYKL